MKKPLASLLALLGFASNAQPQHKAQTIDPNSILFTTPTLSKDAAPLEPLIAKPTSDAFMKLNESQGQILVDWRAQLVLVSVNAQRKLDSWQP